MHRTLRVMAVALAVAGLISGLTVAVRLLDRAALDRAARSGVAPAGYPVELGPTPDTDDERLAARIAAPLVTRPGHALWVRGPGTRVAPAMWPGEQVFGADEAKLESHDLMVVFVEENLAPPRISRPAPTPGQTQAPLVAVGVSTVYDVTADRSVSTMVAFDTDQAVRWKDAMGHAGSVATVAVLKVPLPGPS
jgi:hypothetical protein